MDQYPVVGGILIGRVGGSFVCKRFINRRKTSFQQRINTAEHEQPVLSIDLAFWVVGDKRPRLWIVKGKSMVASIINHKSPCLVWLGTEQPIRRRIKQHHLTQVVVAMILYFRDQGQLIL